MKGSSEEVELECDGNLLTRNIIIQVNNLTQNPGGDLTYLKVNIHDKMSKIQEVLKYDEIHGFLTFEGKFIESPEDKTFAKNFVKNNAKFALITVEG